MFPFYDFWNHVIIIFTNSYIGRGNRKDEVLSNLKNSMKYINIDLPPHIPIFFVDLKGQRRELE